MNSTACRVCKMTVEAIFPTVLLQKHPIQYFHCLDYGYVQTEEPYWLPEAYESSIKDADTGMIMRNLWLRNVATALIYFLLDHKGRFLDLSVETI